MSCKDFRAVNITQVLVKYKLIKSYGSRPKSAQAAVNQGLKTPTVLSAGGTGCKRARPGPLFPV